MANVIFWVVLGLLVTALISSNFIHNRNKKKERYKKLKESFGSLTTEPGDTSYFDEESALLDHMRSKSKDDFYLDAITINDLALRNIYSRMNCVSSCGADYLRYRFKVLPASSDKTEELSEDIGSFLSDVAKATRVMCILDDIGCHSKLDGFDLINKLSETKDSSIAPDILPVIILAGAVVLTAYEPIAGIVAVITMIAVCIAMYFSGRRRMEEHLRGLAYSLRLIRCGIKLSDEYEGLAKYRPLGRLDLASGLIPMKDKTVSDPVSVILDYVRMITHIDIIVYKIKIRKVRENLEDIKELYIDTGRIDAAVAVASYILNRKHCRAYIISDNKINTSQVYHPLVRKPVYNDFSTDRGVLVTGSNASGKSTFLRAIGLNILFAKSFGYAFADSFETGADKLFTSMALSDNLLGQESYYVVEARSLKRICDNADGNCVCLIDEVLRGTNTIERIAASSRILRYLCKKDVLCFAATHDLELTHLLDDVMDCYFFTEEIKDGNVSFPFVIYSGRSDKTNAIRLLDMMGFDKDTVDSANELVNRYKDTGIWSN
ncbi:MAG: hypothetical protein J5910_09390 [Lachnospiraceae bacterium]|nr:hypothetical protein [Lachnospiraceae bacterium]